jgi:predicted alpha/beta-fold hydrolase
MTDDLSSADADSSPLHALGQVAGCHSKTFKSGQFLTSSTGLFQILSSCPSLKSGFNTASLMAHPILQTYVGSHCRSAKLTIARCLECYLPDGGLVTLDLSLPGKLSGHLALIVPGAAGGSDVPYVKSLAKRLFDAGFLVAIMNRRGTTAHTPLKTCEPLQYAKTSDLSGAIALLRENFPDFIFFAVGVSIGANLLLKTLGEHPNCGITFAVSVANGYDFVKGSLHLESTNPFLSKIISGDMIQRLILPWEEILNTSHGVNVRQVFSNCAGMRDFDSRLSKTFFGFDSVDKYYESCTCLTAIDHITVPFVCINALDDPIAHASILPVKQVSQCANGAIVLTDQGGHQGWIDSISCIWGHSWIEHLVAELFQQMVVAHNIIGK